MDKREKKPAKGKQTGVGTIILQLQTKNIKPGSLFIDLDGEEFTDDGRGHVLHNGTDEVGKIYYAGGSITFDREFMDGGTYVADTDDI
jgi:hypothetical protein